MATTIISTLRDGGSGTDIYTSLAAWKAALPASLVTADQVHILEVEAKAGGWAVPGGFDFAGITTDTTRYVEVRPAAGHGHTGVPDTSKVLFTGNVTAANAALLGGNTHTYRYIGLQVDSTGDQSTNAGILCFSLSGGSNRVLNCIVRHKPSSGTVTGGTGIRIASSSTSYVGNNLVYDCFRTDAPANTSYGGISKANTVAAFIYSNTAVNCAYGIKCVATGDAPSTTLKNNLVHCTATLAGRVDFQNVGTANAASTSNASSDATAPGSSARLSQTFTFKNAAGSNWKLAGTDAGAKGFGADLSADANLPLTTDNGGQARSTPWDIGADQVDPGQTLTVTSPAGGNVVQRFNGRAAVTVTGTYEGSPASIRARVLRAGTETIIAGFDWATAVASPSGGAFTFTLTGVPVGGLQWYEVDVSFTDDPAAADRSGQFAVGEVVGVCGQSNAAALFGGTAQSGNASTFVTQTTLASALWTAPAAAGAVGLGNDLVSLLGIPVGLVDTSVSGTSVGAWSPGGAQYINAMAKFNALGGKLGAIVWVQGEFESNGTSYASYLASLGSVFDTGFRVSLGQAALPVVMVPLGVYNDGTASSTHDEIRRAQHVWGGGANNFVVERIDCEVPAASLHLSSTSTGGAWVLGKRCARAVGAAKGALDTWRGPLVHKINKVSSTVYDLVLTHGAGTDIAPATGITGFSITDPGAGNAAIAISSAVRQSANTVRLTLAAAPVAPHPVISHLLTATPTLTGLLRDNSPEAMPLGWVYGQASRTPGTQIVQTLQTPAGSAVAGASGLKWAMWTAATPDQIEAAPSLRGASETTDGSGVMTIDVSAADPDVGQVVWLTVTDSDGTTTQSPAHRAFSGPVLVN